MARGATSSSSRDDQGNTQPKGDKAPKRRCVQSACVPCRKRKSKCDGGTPVCATCTAVYKTPCHYDAEAESRRSKSGPSNSSTTGTKREASDVIASHSTSQDAFNAEFIISSLRKLPEEHVHDFVQHIRKDPKAEIATLAETWHKTVTLNPSTPLELPSLESDLSLLLGKPAVTLTGESRHFGHSANLGLVPEDENFIGGRARSNSALPERQGTTWTNVTHDLEFVKELFNLYFTWSHSFYVIFSRECFYKDFESGRDKYCSPLLVNAICAYACHLTDNPAGRTDPNNFRTAGDHFFTEAKRLLYEDDETPSLTTTQALCIMAMREPSTGRDSTGFRYMGRCIRMCVELGLHLNNNASPTLNLTASEVEVRKVTFWGCFTMDTVYSVCIGRISQLPRAAITLDKPILEETASPPDESKGALRMPPRGITTRMFLQEFATLSELINDNNFMYFAPRERLTSSKLQNCYERYQAWYRQLPAALSLEGKGQPEPHVLVLHMLYFTMIVHLFRPMLKVNLIHSEVRPRDICIDAANTVSRIVKMYRSFYDFRLAHLTIPHILLSVCVVHLLYSKDNGLSRQNLVDGLKGLEDIHECHYFGARSFRIIHSLSRQWDLPFPEELMNSKLLLRYASGSRGINSSPADPLFNPAKTMSANNSHLNTNMPYSPNGHSGRRESLTMFGQQSRLSLATHPGPSRPSSVVSSARLQSPVVDHTPMQTYSTGLPLTSYPYSQPMSATSTTNVPTPSTTSPVSSTADSLFWTPIPGMPGPILPRNNYTQISPMGLDSVLESSDMGKRLHRDGFKINEDWRSSHVDEFNTGPGGSVYGAAGQGQGNGFVHRSNYSQPSEGVVGYQPGGQNDGGDYVSGWWQGANGGSGGMS
ncbi:C6 transcription factor-like protein [Plenodomus tracheiphilus IPT5]|uniref:C6 transcription factor-like protein n=1 Tax=Plenodomus tracheiphilus IPT5 TaxID=1408161 RepID=A0A6A7ASU2_9PLEO|nr:C6 transcription factor-like protein [Plenodomus tracheiphilus IPT5]